VKKIATFLAVLLLLSVSALEIGGIIAWIIDKYNAMFCIEVASTAFITYMCYHHWISAWRLYKELGKINE